ncbi:hypothetical protein TrST_g8916 [Triparma strigata]|uniref:Uncharacterized protein n=1 Tax=Triparma strigata TaxID=1606541 RepID=A0A9W7EJT2_9STRA|nr:hypothetical protein TrST_g8916 [Triparma strigata]
MSLNSALPFPLRQRKLQSLSGVQLSSYRSAAVLPLTTTMPLQERLLMADSGMNAFRKYEKSLTTYVNGLCRLLLSSYEGKEGVPGFLSFLSYNLRKYDLEGTGRINNESFQMSLRQAMSVPDPSAPNPAIYVPPPSVLTDVFSSFALCSAPSIVRNHFGGFVDMEMFMAVVAYWCDYMTNSDVPHTSWLTDKGQQSNRPYTSSSIGKTLFPTEADAPHNNPVASPPRPGHLNTANTTPLKYTIPSSVIGVMTLLSGSKNIFLSTCLKVTGGEPLISLDEFRLCLTHAKVQLTQKQWLTLKEFCLEKGVTDSVDKNKIDYMKLDEIIESCTGLTANPANAPEFYRDPTVAGPSDVISQHFRKERTVGRPPPPLPPHKLLLAAEDRWEHVVSYLRAKSRDGKISIDNFVVGLCENGVMVGKSDAVGLFCAILNLPTGDVDEVRIDIEKLANAFAPKKNSPVQPYHPPTHLSALVQGDIFSMQEAKAQKKKFHDDPRFHDGKVMNEALHGNPGSSTSLRSADPKYSYKEGAPYHIDGQAATNFEIANSPPPPPPPYALQSELGSEIMRTKEKAEEMPPVLKRAREAADKMRSRRFNRDSDEPQDDPVYLCFPDVNYKRVLSLSRSEVMAVFQKLGVQSSGGDIEKLWWWTEHKNEELTRDKLYVLLGGELKKKEETNPADSYLAEHLPDPSSTLSLEHRRTLHHVQAKANSIIRGCTAADADGEGVVSTSVFLNALKAVEIFITDQEQYHVLTAVKETAGKVKYPSIVFNIDDYIRAHEAAVEIPQYSPRRSEPEPTPAGKGTGVAVSDHKMGTHMNYDMGEDDDAGIDQFGYLRINAPSPKKIRVRSSKTNEESVLKEDLAWNVSSLADRVHYSRNSENNQDINLQLTRDVANILFMERPAVAMCFRQYDDDNVGSLTASQVMEMLMSNRLKTGLDGKVKLAKSISLELFEKAGKKPNTTDRLDFNEFVKVVGSILEEEKKEKSDLTAETFQAGTSEYGERRNESRAPQSFEEHINYRVNPPVTVPMVHDKPKEFVRSQLMEESIARSVWSSRSLSIMETSNFQAAAIQIRHSFLRHLSKGSDAATQTYHELACRESDLNGIMYAVGIYLTDAQQDYIKMRCAEKGGGSDNMGMVEKNVVGSYVTCRSLVLFLSGICGLSL